VRFYLKIALCFVLFPYRELAKRENKDVPQNEGKKVIKEEKNSIMC
jgi:hypothetical protein